VVVKRSTMCEGCNAKGACHTLGGGKDMEAQALNSIGASQGDRVLLKIGEGSLLKMSFLVYMLPAMAMIAGAFIGYNNAGTFGFTPELFSIIVSVSLLAVSVLIVILAGKMMKGKRKYMPEVIKILAGGPDDDEVDSC
jgi:sigma-E factor negative regulatory protein RseC